MPEVYHAATPQIIRRSASSSTTESGGAWGAWIVATVLAMTLSGCAHGATSVQRTLEPATPASPTRVSQQSVQVAMAMQALEARLSQLQQSLRQANMRVTTARPAVVSNHVAQRRVHSAVPIAAPPTMPVARVVAVKFTPVPVQPLPAVPPSAIRHKVAPGDTLGAIAHHYLGRASRWREVWRDNPWLQQPRHLRVGQTVTIHTGDRHHQPSSTAPGQSAQPSSQYTVQVGDSLGSIAHRYWGSAILWKRLWQANPALDSPHHIRVGQHLVIPASATQPQQYMVQKGDSLSRLAMVYLGDAGLWRVLERYNPDLQPSRSLTPGQRLRLPAGSAPIPQA